MLCPNSCARTGALDERMSDQHAPARGASLGFEQPTRASPDHEQPMFFMAVGRRISTCVYPEAAWPTASAAARTRPAQPAEGALVQESRDVVGAPHVLVHVVAVVVGPADIGIYRADRDQILLREGVGRDQLPLPRSLVSGDSGNDELHHFDFDRVRVGGGELRPHRPRVPDRVKRLPLVALGFDNEREPVSGREPLVVVCPRQGQNA
eukprot:scaffold33419_cov59-Phaeocystis_antarctica.AAC.2